MKDGVNKLIQRLKDTCNLKGGFALDIGAYTGRDSIFLKENGYFVTALDKNVDKLKECLDEKGFEIIKSDISEIDLGRDMYDLVLANNVLPFVKSEKIMDTIESIVNSIKKDGFFCFSFFGTNDDWSDNKEMNFHTYKDSLDMLKEKNLEIFFQSTEKGVGPTMRGDIKFWEIHRFIAKKN